MKHLFIAVIFSLTVIGNTYATPLSGKNDPTFVGAASFYHQYPQATDIHCKVKGLYTEVNFTWNGLQLQAFYDNDGNPMATTRTVGRNDLPINVQVSLKKQYTDGVVTDAIEYTDENDGLSYFVTLARPKVTYLLRVSTCGEISVFKKMKP